MLYTYNFQCIDRDSDAGIVSITIVEENERQARQHVALLLKKKNRPDIKDRLKLISTTPYQRGIVFENLEMPPLEIEDDSSEGKNSWTARLGIHHPDSF